MKPSEVRKEIENLDEKLCQNFLKVGVQSACKITGTFPTNLYKHIKGTKKFSYKKILEWCDLFNIQ